MRWGDGDHEHTEDDLDDLDADDIEEYEIDELDEQAVVEECEALLAGEYAVFLAESGADIPPWAWLNMIAHATPTTIVSLASTAVPPAEPWFGVEDWQLAVTLLADDIVDQGIEQLAALQLAALIPLELELMLRGDDDGISPGQLAGMALAALHQHPSSFPD